MLVSRAAKTQYSELEAAQELGLTVEQLRALIRTHIVEREDAASPAVATFQASDILLLRLIARQQLTPTYQS